MENMIDHLKSYRFGAHILDGPTGPIGIVKPGVIKMARETHATIVPFYTRADRAWFFNSWDRFMLPKPFSKVWIRFGPAIKLEEYDSDQEFERQRQTIETTMQPHLFFP